MNEILKILFLIVDVKYIHHYPHIEARVNDYDGSKFFLKNSRKSLKEYFKIIDKNSKIIPTSNEKEVWNLISGNKLLYNIKYGIEEYSQIITCPIERNSEILVRIPHIPLSWAHSIYFLGKLCKI